MKGREGKEGGEGWRFGITGIYEEMDLMSFCFCFACIFWIVEFRSCQRSFLVSDNLLLLSMINLYSFGKNLSEEWSIDACPFCDLNTTDLFGDTQCRLITIHHSLEVRTPETGADDFKSHHDYSYAKSKTGPTKKIDA
jgi:hypothetical protein